MNSRYLESCDQACYHPESKNDEIKTSIIANFVDYFVYYKGLASIFEIIFSTNKEKDTDSYIDFSILEILIDFLACMDIYLNFNLNHKDKILQLKEYISMRIKNITELELKETSVATIINILKQFRIILARSNTISNIFCDEALLNYFFNNLLSKNLERRVRGITYINKFITIITTNEFSVIK